ncbi:MAG: hypothetical protein ACFFDN_11570 [Candidatus Hodarchaeota archaeon]
MVCVDFHLKIAFEEFHKFLESIGYIFIGSDEKSLKFMGKWLSTEVFIRKTKKGRHHFYVEYGRKLTGTRHYPRAKIFAHYDIIRLNKNNQKRHFFDSSDIRTLKELHRIEKLMNKNNYGSLAFKDQHSAHSTLKFEDRNSLNTLYKLIKKEYEIDELERYKKTQGNTQYIIHFIEQKKYVHVICICALKIPHKPDVLLEKKALKEINRIKKMINESKYWNLEETDVE